MKAKHSLIMMVILLLTGCASSNVFESPRNNSSEQYPLSIYVDNGHTSDVDLYVDYQKIGRCGSLRSCVLKIRSNTAMTLRRGDGNISFQFLAERFRYNMPVLLADVDADYMLRIGMNGTINSLYLRNR